MEPALVLGSHTVGLGMTRALGVMGVPVVAMYYDEADHGYVSKYVQERIRSPHPERNEDDFIEFLVGYATRFEGSFLIPASDATLAAVSRHKELLERHYIVGCPEWEITKLFVDKKHTYALADRYGIPAPKTTVPRSVEDVERYANEVQYPCLVKPCQGHQYFEVFHRKMVMANSFDQMLHAYREATDAKFEVVLQEFIPGDSSHGVNYNSYSWGGKALVEFTAAKIRNAPRDTGSPCVAQSQFVSEVLEPGRRILQAMDFHGYACTEFKRDARDGVYKLMEVNGRHNLSSLLAVSCGINFPWIHYEHLVHGKLPEALRQQTGLYWIDLVRDLSASPGYLFKERYPVRRYLKPYLDPHVFAILDSTDPKPFRKRCSSLLKSVFKH
ncbi:MAG: hypothetical protein CVT67_08915 [Actinobacteria bacterium HGW-Actinobacteria-7]|nr:MAG: hypothetical protein CVT67_08915 [Actinobacteria bacterium HGW-Actinobacteria-7]